MEAALRTFFSSPRFAVAGASSDPSKFGHKVFAWYLLHSLPATPVNPRCPSVNVLSRSHTTVPGPSALQSPSETSLSVITPPPVTLKLLKEAKEAGIPAVWLQPGSFDDEGLAYARKEFKAAIAGMEPGTDGLASVGGEGWCVLVDGERGLSIAGRKWERLKL
ncbi:NAD(P)-binding protein [Rhizodiscina lignyota]|uniref:NAD(P)-binding protein n=1 Tax=Rhizodiscina lignyota TaxID=1504668 RepID=A0A9P4IDD8_9PEZI|nr:NAD(P)-binding protein [Rhizodiscina lignyota]